jgi:NTP pyrophosphatase (non-canonical NTP hydrolase)
LKEKGYIMNEVEKEVLLIAQEECAEVTQAISKVFRFGIDAVHLERTNRQRLTEEVGDLFCMIQLMIENKIINIDEVEQASQNKRKKLQTWSDIFTKEKI